MKKRFENKKILCRRLTVILLAMTMTFFLPVTVQSEVVPDHWNYYATYDFDLLESNARISAIRVVAHIDGTTVKVDTNIDDTPEYTFTLNEGDMWENDLPTGTHIWSSEELTVHQYDDYQWDYKEVILPAVRYWDNGYYYGGVISFKLGTNHILITAAYDNTYVAIDLDNDGTPDLTNTLNEGQVWDISAAATTLSGESLPGGRWVGYDTRAGAHIYTTTDNTFTTPGGNMIQVHAYATMQEYFGSAYNVIPTTSLGKEYIFPRVDCLNPLYWDRADKMIFVATEPSTTINIDHDHDGSTDVTINLANVGDWDYWPHGSIDNAWSHGAYVSANEEIVAFYSSPGGGRYWDGFMSQMMPKLSARSDYWNSNGLSTDRSWSTPYIHFFAYEDGTTLYRDTNNDGTADFTYNLDFLDGGLKITASKEGEHFWVDDPDNHHVTMYQRLYYSASDTMSPISYQVLEQQDTIPPGKVTDLKVLDLTPTGFAYPTGTKEDGIFPYNYDEESPSEPVSYYLFDDPGNESKWGWLARGDEGDYGCWLDDCNKYRCFYHIAQDIPTRVGDPVYAIADGEIVYVSTLGWGADNYGLFVRHTVETGEVFRALYGHVRPDDDDLKYTVSGVVDPPIEVHIGESFATIGPWGSYPHLHFAIRESDDLPVYLPCTADYGGKGYGIMWDYYWPDTNGFTDPINYIITETPKESVSPLDSVILCWTAPADDGYDPDSESVIGYDVKCYRLIWGGVGAIPQSCVFEVTNIKEPNKITSGIVSEFSPPILNGFNYKFTISAYDDEGQYGEESDPLYLTIPGGSFCSRCPVDIMIVDPDGLTVSKNHNEVPDAMYYEMDIDGNDDADDIISIPLLKEGDYTFYVIPEPDADPEDTFTLEVYSNGQTVVLADEKQIGDIPNQPYIIRSTETEIFQIIPTTIDIDPDTLNLKSKGKWITCYIELPEGYDVANINISTILLNDVVPAEDHPTNIGDYDNDGIPDLMVKFDRQDVIDILEVGENVAITVSGKLFDETRFEGTDYIKVI